jgi:Ca2+-binding EF-hand superfamily protein
MEVDRMHKVFLHGALTLGAVVLLSAAAAAQHAVADMPGPIDSIQDLQQTAKMLFKMADTNNDGQISQKEATDVGNLLVGGFFFRADANGDGVLSPEEARAARVSLFQQQPILRYVLQKARPRNAAIQPANQPGQLANTGQVNEPVQTAQNVANNPIRTITNLLDANHDQRIQATELRQAVQMVVQTLFTVADTNRDGLLSPAELNAAVDSVALQAVQIAFQAADTDRNGALSQAEFDKAITEPAHAAFRVLDANNDNQLSMDELQRAQQIIVSQIQRLRVPEPSNSMMNQMRSGIATRPVQVAPSPSTITTPAPATTAQP